MKTLQIRTNNRRYGYSVIGTRCRQKGKRFSHCTEGIVAYQSIEGSFNSESFYQFIVDLLGHIHSFIQNGSGCSLYTDWLCSGSKHAAVSLPRSVLVVDGASVHDQSQVEQLLAA